MYRKFFFYVFDINISQVNLAQFVLYFFLSPETNFDPTLDSFRQKFSFHARYFGPRRFSQKPLRLVDFILPLYVGRHHTVWITTAAYAVVFNFAFVLLTVELPQIFGEKFHFNTQQIGLQFLGLIIGGIIGEQAAGPLGDFAMAAYTRRHQGQNPRPEFRL